MSQHVKCNFKYIYDSEHLKYIQEKTNRYLMIENFLNA